MTAGALLQLVAYGSQDEYLTGNPQITFFKVVYRRHTNFAMESVVQTWNGTVGSGNAVTATISRNGDLVGRCYLQTTIGTASATPANPGHTQIDYVEVEILNTSDGAMPNKSDEKISEFINKTGAVVQPKQAWTDIARFFEHKIPCINFGPGNPLLAHATNEHVSKKQLLESYELLSGYLGVKSE